MKRTWKGILIGCITITVLVYFVYQGAINKNAVNIYTAIEEEYLEQYLSDFHKKYPHIKLNIIRDSGGVISSKLMIEKDNPVADIVWGIPASSILLLDQYGIFKPYKSENLENIDERFYDTLNKEPHWVGICAWMTAFTVNELELKNKNLPIPKSYKDLLNPEYKDNIIMPNPASSGTGFLTVSAWLQMFEEEGAWGYMDKLHKNIGEYSHSGSAPTKQTAKGEFLIGVGMDFLSLQMEKDNSQIKTIFPEEGSGWESEVIAIMNKKDLKTEAITFYEWALSQETMNMYAENRSLITTKGYKPKDENKYLKGIENQMIENDFYWASQNRNKILKQWESRYGVGE